MATSVPVTLARKPLFDVLLTSMCDLSDWITTNEASILARLNAPQMSITKNSVYDSPETKNSWDDLDKIEGMKDEAATKPSGRVGQSGPRTVEEGFNELIALPFKNSSIEGLLTSHFDHSSTDTYVVIVGFLTRILARTQLLQFVKDELRRERLENEMKAHVLYLSDGKTDGEKEADQLTAACVRRIESTLSILDRFVKKYEMTLPTASEMKRLMHDLAKCPAVIQSISATETVTQIFEVAKGGMYILFH